jgi:hypothetical protein
MGRRCRYRLSEQRMLKPYADGATAVRSDVVARQVVAKQDVTPSALHDRLAQIGLASCRAVVRMRPHI